MLSAFGFASDNYATEEELDAELLIDVLSLTHPDRHPAERQEFATRVTAALNALRPYVRPRRPSPARDASATVRTTTICIPVTTRTANAYPCPSCRHQPPWLYCDPCNRRWTDERHARLDADNAKQRARRARRRWRRQHISCASCGTSFPPARSDSRYCGHACRQRAYRLRMDGAA